MIDDEVTTWSRRTATWKCCSVIVHLECFPSLSLRAKLRDSSRYNGSSQDKRAKRPKESAGSCREILSFHPREKYFLASLVSPFIVPCQTIMMFPLNRASLIAKSWAILLITSVKKNRPITSVSSNGSTLICYLICTNVSFFKLTILRSATSHCQLLYIYEKEETIFANTCLLNLLIPLLIRNSTFPAF